MKLQNNNRKPIEARGARIPQDTPYISQPKAIEYPKQNLFGTLATAISDLSTKSTQMIAQYTNKSKQIKAENLQNDYLLDYNNLTKRYKLDYTRDPENEKITEQYEKDLKQLKDTYAKKIPMEYREFWSKTTDQIEKNVDLDFFRSQTNLQHQMNLFENKLNENLDIIRDRASKGDLEGTVSLILMGDNFKRQMLEIYGTDIGSNLYREYKNKMLDSILSASLSSGRTAQLNLAIKTIENSKELRQGAGEKLNHYKKQLQHLQQEEEERNRRQQQINYWFGDSELFKKVNSEKLDYSDLIELLKQNHASPQLARSYLKLQGYSTDLPPDLIEVIGGKTANNPTQARDPQGRFTKFSNGYEAENRIRSEIWGLTLYSIDELQQDDFNSINKKINWINEAIASATADKLITISTAENLKKQLNEYTFEINRANNKINNVKWGWFSKTANDVFEKETTRVLKNMGIDYPLKKLKNIKNTEQRNRALEVANYFMRAKDSALEYIFQREKANSEKYKDLENKADFYELQTSDNNKKFVEEARLLARMNFQIGQLPQLETIKRQMQKDDKYSLTEISEAINEYYNNYTIDREEQDLSSYIE